MKQRRISTWVVLLTAAVALELAGCGGGGGGGGGFFPPSGRPGVNVTRVGTVQGLNGGFGASHPALSQDGRYVAFQADFTNLLGPNGDTNNVTDVFVYDRFANTTTRVSRADGAGVGPGTEADGACEEPAISPNGRYVAFNSRSTTLVATINPFTDVYVRDTDPLNPRTVRMSVGNANQLANADSLIAGNAITVDTTTNNVLVAFYTNATNLFPALDNNGNTHIYLRNCTPAFACTTVPVDNTNVQANADSLDPSISKNGRFIVYSSFAKNLGPPLAADGTSQIFVYDRVGGSTAVVSVDNTGAAGNGNSTLASISATGRYVVFTSRATNLVPGDNNVADVYLHDRDVSGSSGTFDTPGNIRTTRISVSSAGAAGNGDSSISIFPILSISDDGKFVVYETLATNFDPFGDTNGVTDVYLYNTVTKVTSRMSLSASGAQANNFSIEPTISGDGKVMAYSSIASDLVGGDTNTFSDVFVVALP